MHRYPLYPLYPLTYYFNILILQHASTFYYFNIFVNMLQHASTCQSTNVLSYISNLTYPLTNITLVYSLHSTTNPIVPFPTPSLSYPHPFPILSYPTSLGVVWVLVHTGSQTLTHLFPIPPLPTPSLSYPTLLH